VYGMDEGPIGTPDQLILVEHPFDRPSFGGKFFAIPLDGIVQFPCRRPHGSSDPAAVGAMGRDGMYRDDGMKIKRRRRRRRRCCACWRMVVSRCCGWSKRQRWQQHLVVLCVCTIAILFALVISVVVVVIVVIVVAVIERNLITDFFGTTADNG